MKILLVKPRWFVHGGQYRYLENVRFTPLSLGILAALSGEHEIRIVDGDWERIPVDEDFDLVGITATTFTSQRAFDLAAKFKERGARVVIGGVHPSIMPKETLKHADAIVVGEAEYLWTRLLEDAERGKLEGEYRAERPTEMDDVPVPRRDLLNEPSWFACLQATRGCPNGCKYCYLPSVPWRAFRKRSIELVVDEVANMPQKLGFLVDDNVFGDREYALALFKALAPLKKNWSVQAPTTIGSDPEILDAMREAGFFNVQIGFQSFNKQSLADAAVDHNRVENYQGLVEQLHRRGILATGFFIFGFDADGPDTFEATTEMIRRIRLDDANLYILTPYPGTAMHARFEAEGRLLSGTERTQFGWANAVFRPARMTPEELENGVQEAYESLHPYFRRRMAKALFKMLKLLLKHPQLIRVFVGGGLRRANLDKGVD